MRVWTSSRTPQENPVDVFQPEGFFNLDDNTFTNMGLGKLLKLKQLAVKYPNLGLEQGHYKCPAATTLQIDAWAMQLHLVRDNNLRQFPCMRWWRICTILPLVKHFMTQPVVGYSRYLSCLSLFLFYPDLVYFPQLCLQHSDTSDYRIH